MKVLVTGFLGQLGQECVRLLEQRGIEAVGVDKGDFDLTDAEATAAYVTSIKPDAVMHCAAYTAVDKAETEPEVCAAVNAMGTLNLVRAALRVNAKFMYVSTDYVFSGTGEEPFDTDSPYCPTNVYGLTKAQGEEAVRSLTKRFFIVRTSWVFGMGANFVRTMLRLGNALPDVKVVNDQVGSPTYTVDLARLMCDMIVTEKYGVYHATNEGFCSWAEFAAEIMRLSGRRCPVKPVTTAEYGSTTKRPANSRLSKRSLDEAGFARLPDWQDALARYLLSIGELKA